MYGNPALWNALLRRLTDITITFLQVQVAAGASAVQLFDSWAGAVSPEDYRRSVLPHSKRIFDALAGSGVPRLHFGVSTGELLGMMGEAGADVVGVDWRVPLDEAVRRVEPGKALQGNLDPAILLAPVGGRRAAGHRGPGRGPHGRGARVQPRPRRAAADRSRRAGPAGRPGAHRVGPGRVNGPGPDPRVGRGSRAARRADGPSHPG